MPEQTDKETLTKIQASLEDIKAILTLANSEKLEEAKKLKLKEGPTKLQVYNLYNGTKSTQEIAQAIQKSTDYVNSYLSILRHEGLIGTTERSGKQIHEQLF